ncbi:MAG: exopolyphosphatase [Fidelibacterota bacterium]|nr:MAG: exopolyphosphatase [Candidatus Neomarinimicrobiota bacterium]
MKAIIRGDLDGIVCATLLKAAGQVDTVSIVSIRDILDGKVKVTDQDIVCNLPFQPDAYMWFDHHSSETKNVPPLPDDFRGGFALAPSTAGVVYKYLLLSNPEIERFAQLVRDTDMLDSADLTEEDIRNPQGTILLGLLLDPRTRMYSNSNYKDDYLAWKLKIPDLLLEYSTEEILAMPEAREWQRIYRECQEEAIRILQGCSYLDGNVIISDFRGKMLAPVNRFILYTLPDLSDGNISVQIADGEPGVWDEIAVGHSIFKRTSMVDVGELCSWYGGGGHRTVGVCRPSVEDAEQVFREIIAACKEPSGP